MKLKFHEHAVQRMQERKISVDEVGQIIEEPDGKIRQSQDKWILYKKLKKRKDNLLAAVIVDRGEEDWIEVITVLINFEVRK
jgi:hypothetical protein